MQAMIHDICNQLMSRSKSMRLICLISLLLCLATWEVYAQCPSNALNLCISCTDDGSVCSGCTNTNFKRSADATTCIYCPGEFCLQCSSSTVCSVYDNASCRQIVLEGPFRSNIDGTNCFPCNVANCDFCFAAEACQSCVANFGLDGAGNCVTCAVINCLQCATNPPDAGLCAVCQNPLQRPDISQTVCVSCSIPGCSQCVSTGVCFQCDTIGGVAYTPTVFLDSCIRCDVSGCQFCQTPTLCAFCFPPTLPLLPNQNQCVQCPVTQGTCLFCRADGSCGICQTTTGASLNPIDNRPNTAGNNCFQCAILGCQFCSSNGVCQQCLDTTFKTSFFGTFCNRCTIPLCLTCDATDACSSCDSSDGIIRKPTPNGQSCIQCSLVFCTSCSTPNVCAAFNTGLCSTGTLPNLAATGCFDCQTITGCANCNTNGAGGTVCQACLGNLLLSSNGLTCSPCPLGCAVCSAANTCITCTGSNQKPNLAKTECVDCILNCDFCDTAGRCAKCSGNLFLSADRLSCQPCPLGCAVCSAPNVCTTCTNPLFRPNSIGDVCVSCNVPNCASCNTNDVCVRCTGNLVLSAGGSTCGPCPSFCQTCSSPSVCQTCVGAPNVLPDFVGSICYSCPIPGCINCNAINNCVNCQGNLVLSANGQTCGPCFSTCRLCSSPDICQLCLQSTQKPTQDGRSCVACTIPGCQSCDATGRCIKCLGNSFLSTLGLTCEPCPTSCAICSAPNICSTCNNIYEKPNVGGNQCNLCTVPNCVRCSGPNVCAQCNIGRIPTTDGSVCVACPSFCLQCDIAGACQQCVSNLQRPNLAGNACFPCNIIANCDRCSGIQICERCTAGLNLINNQCLAPVSCPSFCLQCNSSGACQQCVNNLQRPNLVGNACLPCNNIANCDRCSGVQICERCTVGLNLINNQCLAPVSCPSFCLQCNSSGACQQCVNNLQRPNLAGNACFPCNNIANCDRCSGIQICARCIVGLNLNLNLNQCVAPSTCPSGCVCDISGKCIGCNIFGQKPNLAGTRCSNCPITPCVACSSDGVCESCSPGYVLDNFGTVCRLIPNLCPQLCVSCDSSNRCISYKTCPSSLQLPNFAGTQCFLCNITNCKHCSSANVCEACLSPNLVLSNGQSCGLCQTWCKTCSISYRCVECLGNSPTFPVLPNESGTYCVECAVPNCGSCYSRNICSTCKSIGGLPAKPNRSGSTCVRCNVPNCMNCDFDNTCARCEAIYNLIGNQCLGSL